MAEGDYDDHTDYCCSSDDTDWTFTALPAESHGAITVDIEIETEGEEQPEKRVVIYPEAGPVEDWQIDENDRLDDETAKSLRQYVRLHQDSMRRAVGVETGK